MPGTITPGLCSVSFRTLEPEAIVRLCEDTGLRAIEWGADVHLPPGRVADAASLARRCREAGIACPSYGSYWFAGQSEADELTPVLDSAAALGATRVRVWSRFGAESDAPAADKAAIADALAAAVLHASERGLALATRPSPPARTRARRAWLARRSSPSPSASSGPR